MRRVGGMVHPYCFVFCEADDCKLIQRCVFGLRVLDDANQALSRFCVIPENIVASSIKSSVHNEMVLPVCDVSGKKALLSSDHS